MTSLPTGTVTFLFSDVEGSTARWERDPETMRAAMAELDRLVDKTVSAAGGTVVKDRGEGDSHFCVFSRAGDAVAAGAGILRALADSETTVRLGVHTGEADLRDGDYYGRSVNRAARIRSAAHGGQLLVSETTASLLAGNSIGVSLVDLGEFRLKDLTEPQRLHRADVPGLPVVDKIPIALDNLRNNLPSQMDELIGREAEVAAVRSSLERQRLVELVALGGAGKTRLALQVAAEMTESFPGGIWLTQLAPLTEPDLIAEAIRDAVRAPLAGEAAQSTIEWVGDRKVLLILDNCEHLAEPVAHLVRQLLAGASGLRVLVTSRVPLGVPGEAIFPVPPLGLSTTDGPEAAEAPAVRLFAERAQLVDPNFTLDEGSLPAVVELAKRLDGLPLALELAAARTAVLSPVEMLERLSRGLATLTNPGEPNRTVTAAIEWSYEMLKPDTATLLRRLAVFEGAIPLAMVEDICGEGIEDVLSSLEELVRVSLAVSEGRAGSRRYRLLDLVRSAARRLTAPDEREDTERRRLDWLLRVAQEVREEAFAGKRPGARPAEQLVSATTETWAALGWAERARPELYGAFGTQLLDAWICAERRGEADRLLAHLRPYASALEPTWRAYFISAEAALEFRRDRWKEALELSNEARPLAEEVGDRTLQLGLENTIACAHWARDELDPAEEKFTAILDEVEGLEGFGRLASLIAHNLGLVAESRGDEEGAFRWWTRSAELGKPVSYSSTALERIAAWSLRKEDPSASAHIEVALEAARSEADQWSEVILLEMKAGRERDRATRKRLLEEAVAVSVFLSPTLRMGPKIGLARLAQVENRDAEMTRWINEAFKDFSSEPSWAFATMCGLIEGHIAHFADLALLMATRLEVAARRDASAGEVLVARLLRGSCLLEVGKEAEGREVLSPAVREARTIGADRLPYPYIEDLLKSAEARLASVDERG